jgi:hypothetical protein
MNFQFQGLKSSRGPSLSLLTGVQKIDNRDPWFWLRWPRESSSDFPLASASLPLRLEFR